MILGAVAASLNAGGLAAANTPPSGVYWSVVPTQIPFLSILVAIPLLGALILALVKPLHGKAHLFGLLTSVVALVYGVLAVATTFDFSAAQDYQLAETYKWIPQIGVSWALGLNGLGLVMLFLALALVVAVMAATWKDFADRPNTMGYVAWTLVLEAIMVVLFTSRDIFLFYVAFEAMLIPLYFLIGHWGGQRARAAAIKFLLYSLAGGLVMLIGVVGIFVYGGGSRQAYLLEVAATDIPANTSGTLQLLLFLSFFIAFAIKAPMVPVHTWLPDTAEAANPGTTTLLVGVLDKVGTFGMITFCLNLFPEAAAQAAVPICVLAVISVLYGGLVALGQKDIMRLISFTSVSHFGFMVLGIFVGSSLAMTGAMVYMVAHGISIAGLFLISSFLTRRAATQDMASFGGMQRVTPILAGTFLVSGLASVALPGLSGFVPEYMVIMGSLQARPAVAAVSILGVVIAALYLLLPYKQIFTGPVPTGDIGKLPDLDTREKSVVAPLVAAMLVLGFFPAPVINLVSPIGHYQTAEMQAQNLPANSGGVEEGSAK